MMPLYHNFILPDPMGYSKDEHCTLRSWVQEVSIYFIIILGILVVDAHPILWMAVIITSPHMMALGA
jgi:hypothetical protein